MRFSKAVTEYLYGVSLIKLKFLNKYRDKLLIVLFSRLYIEHSLHKRERINCCDDHELLYNGICMTFGNHGIVLNNSTACYNFIRSQTTNDLNCLLEPVHQVIFDG